MQMVGRSWVEEKKKKGLLLKEQMMHETDVSTLAEKRIICICLYKNDPQVPTCGFEHLSARSGFPESTQFLNCYKTEKRR